MLLATETDIAHYVHLYILAILVCLKFKGTSTSLQSQHVLKSLHFTLYQHDTLNETGPGLTQSTGPFGILYMLCKIPFDCYIQLFFNVVPRLLLKSLRILLFPLYLLN